MFCDNKFTKNKNFLKLYTRQRQSIIETFINVFLKYFFPEIFHVLYKAQLLFGENE